MLRLLSAFLTGIAYLFGQTNSTAQQHAEKAIEFAQHGDLRSAEGELRKAVEISPDDSALLTSLGGILGMEGELQRANAYLAKAVEVNPKDGAARRNLAANQWQLGQFKEAHQNLDRLLNANPGDRVATYLLGMVSEREGNYERSIALLESIPDIGERQQEALPVLASSYYHTRRPQQARAILQKLVGRSVKPEVLLMGGRVAMDAADYGIAGALLSQIPSTEVNRTGHAGEETYLRLCRILSERADYEKALAITSKAVHAFPDSYEAVSMKASIEMKLSYFSQAAASLQAAARLNPSPEAKRDLAVAEWRAGERQKAAEEFERAMRQFPRDGQIRETYGTLLLEDTSPEYKARAIELLNEALAVDDSLIEARYQLANNEFEEGRLEPALGYLTSALKLDPDASRLHFALSRVYRRLGRDSDATREMEVYQKLKAAEQTHP